MRTWGWRRPLTGAPPHPSRRETVSVVPSRDGFFRNFSAPLSTFSFTAGSVSCRTTPTDPEEHVAEDGFREFVEVRYTDLLRTAYLLTGSTHAAEDLVQSALIRAMRRWRDVQEPMAYVRRIMVNERLSRWRRIGSRELLTGVIGDWGRGREPQTRDVADGVVVRDELLGALNGLPARMRAVLVLRYWEDLSEAQIAELLGCSVGTVKSQASRGLARLRTVLPPPAPDATPLPAPASASGPAPAPARTPLPPSTARQFGNQRLPADTISGRNV
ncbi:SigE family RNA polymerase sigma factor [Plantactinospora sp. B5E13]|uniref:SigE family RNA polymerase sigma factor n=1 Tax=unclassified Plantactinospora TaxID=2631981 RepID=UPI00325D1122